MNNEMTYINVEVETLNLENVKNDLLDYVDKNAKIDITESVKASKKSALDAEVSAINAANSAILASEYASQTIADLEQYYSKNQTDELLAGKANIANTLTGYGITDAYTKSEVDTALSGKQNSLSSAQLNAVNSGITSAKVTQYDGYATGKANTGLDNLSSDGQMVIDSQNGTISNCILDIPQNLKLELSNNVLTLKSGSIVVTTGETYSTVTTTSDTTFSILVGNYDYEPYYVFCYGNMTLQLFGASKVFSGNELPASLPKNHDLFYLTTDKKIYQWQEASQSFSVTGYRYPLAIIQKKSSTEVTFAKDSNGNDMIFNGAGFIGHHAFVYPNVSGLTPQKFNADGTLKSGLRTNTSLAIIEMNQGQYGGYNRVISLIAGNPVNNSGSYIEIDTRADVKNVPWIRQYVKNENVIVARTPNDITEFLGSIYPPQTPLLEYNYDGTTVTQFDIRQPVRLATTEMLDKIQSQVDTNTTAISGKQDTLVSGTNIKTINSTTVLGSGNFTLANQSLSNLDSTGQMIVDSANGAISNCILDIPQNLKLELSNNVLTLKSGSVLALVDRSIYTTVTTTQDYSITYTNQNGTFFIIFTGTGITGTWTSVSNLGSGTSLPADNSQYSMFFLISNGYGTYYNWNAIINDWSKWNVDGSYPLAIVNVVNGVASFAKDSNGNDLIFNGAGFIGHHAFVYPNVKVLASNGFNANGTLASVSLTTDKFYILDIFDNTRNLGILLEDNHTSVYNNFLNYTEVDTFDEVKAISTGGAYRYTFCRETNSIWLWNANTLSEQTPRKLFISHHYENGVITQFDVYQPVRMATVEMVEKKADDSSVVKLTGNQTVAGVKTFTSNPVISSTQPQIQFVDSDFSKGTVPLSALRNTFFVLRDSSNLESGNIGTFYQRVDEYGNNYIAIVAFKNASGSNDNAQIGIYYNVDGTSYATCPTPPAGDNSIKIATTKWVNDYFASITGYDATKTQTLKNVSGTLTWVDD